MTPKRVNTAGRFLKKFRVKKAPSIIVLTLLLGGVWFWWSWATSFACQVDCQAKIFVVRKGEGLGLIAQRLEEEKLLRSSLAFQIEVARLGLGRKIQAGDFRLSPAMKPEEIAQTLTHGTLDRWVTFIEGLRREEMAAILVSSEFENFRQEEFLNLTKNLEGQLFPDTYLLPKGVDAQRVVSTLTYNFEKKTASLGFSPKDLILASIVEREAKFTEDRPIVAGILLKRLTSGWPLQVDATVQYAVANAKCSPRGEAGKMLASRRSGQNAKCKWWPNKLTKEDLRINSAYNTYLHLGLPPTPIANPGLASLKAALHPQKTDYWYYLSDQGGKMHYAKTLEEHQQNIVRYLTAAD